MVLSRILLTMIGFSCLGPSPAFAWSVFALAADLGSIIPVEKLKKHPEVMAHLDMQKNKSPSLFSVKSILDLALTSVPRLISEHLSPNVRQLVLSTAVLQTFILEACTSIWIQISKKCKRTL